MREARAHTPTNQGDTMAQLGPLTVTVSVSLGATKMPIAPITFDVDLRTIEETTYADTEATFSVNLDRTELRAQLNKAVRKLGDQVEGAFNAPSLNVVACDECDAQILNLAAGVLRHEGDGSHSIAVYATVAHATPASDAAEVASGTVIGRFSVDAADDEATQ